MVAVEYEAMVWTDFAYILVALAITLVVVCAVLPLVYPRGRQVQFRIGNGSRTGKVLGTSGFRLRVQSLHTGTEHTVAPTRVRRR
jgi:hypothetical protein